METLKLTFTVQMDESRQVTLNLPDDLPLGEIEITVTAKSLPSLPEHPTREQVLERLVAAGLAHRHDWIAPPDVVELTDEELDALVESMPLLQSSSSDYINEDREERF